jgi:hypothetical protein
MVVLIVVLRVASSVLPGELRRPGAVDALDR